MHPARHAVLTLHLSGKGTQPVGPCPLAPPSLLGNGASWHGLEAQGTQGAEFILPAEGSFFLPYWQPHQKPCGTCPL